MSTPNIRRANKASTLELAPDLPKSVHRKGEDAKAVELSLKTSAGLSPSLRTAVYDLFDANMSAISAGTSMACSRTSKKAELFHPDTRFLLLVDASSGRLQGYCSFRFDTEMTASDDELEVIYCYELQLSSALRGQGLGRVLMTQLEGIGTRQRMRKSMLTCLKKNSSAIAFYTKMEYQPDEIDPTRMAEEEEWEDEDGSDGGDCVDYIILSKKLDGL